MPKPLGYSSLSPLVALAVAVLAGCNGSGTSPTPGTAGAGGTPSGGGPGGGGTGGAGAGGAGSGGAGAGGGAGSPAGGTGGGAGGAVVAPDAGTPPRMDGGMVAPDGQNPAAPTLTAILTQGLAEPRDLAFNPRRPKELWVVSALDGSVAIIQNAPDETRMAEKRRDIAYSHFMDRPTAIAFGADALNPTPESRPVTAPGTFATCGESRNRGDDFMGPVLWPSDLAFFARQNGPLGSHVDMLHASPLCTGLAWHGEGNVYWAISTVVVAAIRPTTRAIFKYDFKLDHGSGNDDHSDGAIWLYSPPNAIADAPGIPSGLVYRPEDKMLYFSDPGNGRVGKMDTQSGAPARQARCSGDPFNCTLMNGVTVVDVVPKGVVEKPAGLDIRGEALFVADHATSTLHRFNLKGEPQGAVKLPLPAGALGGIAVGPDNKVYFVDMPGNRVLRLDSPL